MFEGLIDRFQVLQRRVRGYGRITKTEIDTILRDMRIVLLEADVNFMVVKEFIEGLGKKAQTLELARSVNPGDLILKAVYEEMVMLLGGSPRFLELKTNMPTVINLLGLQGTGKTTTSAKLAHKFRNQYPLLVPADSKRPAAIEQLNQLAQRAGITFFPMVENDVIKTVKQAVIFAHENEHKIVIIDTAGRLHIDEDLVGELSEIDRVIKPHYRLLVADGMTGQDAVNQAKAFKERVGLDGVILTKMDGDARGGAALSIARTSAVPIYFIGTSENIEGLEEFYPDRIAQRILGMGDVVSLVEKVKTIEQDVDREKLSRKIAAGNLNLEDFMNQLRAVKKLGPLAKLAAMIPGAKETDVDENELMRIEAMIYSMTKHERKNPDVIDGSRKRRIAAGSGTTVSDVNQLLKQFYYVRDLIRKMSTGKTKQKPSVPYKTQ